MLQILAACSRDSCPKNRTPNLHVGLIEGIHDSLDPVIVDLDKKHLDGLFGRGTRRVGANSCG